MPRRHRTSLSVNHTPCQNITRRCVRHSQTPYAVTDRAHLFAACYTQAHVQPQINHNQNEAVHWREMDEIRERGRAQRLKLREWEEVGGVWGKNKKKGRLNIVMV